MLCPQRLLQDCQGALVKRLGFAIPPLNLVEPRQVVESRHHLTSLGPQRVLPDRQQPLVEGLRFAVTALGGVTYRQVVEDCRSVGAPGSILSIQDGKRSLEEQLGLGVAALDVIDPAEGGKARAQAFVLAGEFLRQQQGSL
jgi:hypothetical protein